MGSFKANGREQGPNRRRDRKQARRQGFLRLESLEERTLLSGNPVWHPTNNNLADVQNGPMGNLGGDLVNTYEKFLHTQGDVSQLQTQFPLLQFKGNSVLIGVNDG